jgi:protein gp37
MATKIEWTERTWNPIHGCTEVSEACQNCYAKVMARRLQGNHIKSYEEGFKVTRNMDAMQEPYGWKKPSMVFVVSMGDLFHDDVPDTWLNPVMRIATAAMQALIVGGMTSSNSEKCLSVEWWKGESIAHCAVTFANALIEELKKQGD